MKTLEVKRMRRSEASCSFPRWSDNSLVVSYRKDSCPHSSVTVSLLTSCLFILLPSVLTGDDIKAWGSQTPTMFSLQTSVHFYSQKRHRAPQSHWHILFFMLLFTVVQEKTEAKPTVCHLLLQWSWNKEFTKIETFVLVTEPFVRGGALEHLTAH